METLIITEGTSESAKAIGIRKAKGEVIGILASDNQLSSKWFLADHVTNAQVYGAAYPAYYEVGGDWLNRCFALLGGNDPLAYYMGKNDKLPHFSNKLTFKDGGSNKHFFDCSGTTLGDNGFFVRKDLIEKTDLDNYYHIDNANEIGVTPKVVATQIFHNTGGNIFKFLAKRYRYGLQHAFNSNRRWHLVDFSKPEDIRRLVWFVLCGLTFIHPLIIAMRGYSKLKDIAWFVHPIMCFLTVVTYAALVCHLGLRPLYQSLFARLAVRTA